MAPFFWAKATADSKPKVKVRILFILFW